MTRRPKRPPALWKQIQNARPRSERPRTEAQRKAAELRLYRKEAREFVRVLNEIHVTCPVLGRFYKLPPEMQRVLIVPWTGNRRSNKLTECHHTHGRRLKLLRYKPWWLAVSKFGHRAIHMFPKVAREFGWLCEVGQFNVPPPESP